MKSWDYEAVTFDGDIYCTGCVPENADKEEISPVFASDEWAGPHPRCGKCGYVFEYLGEEEGVC